MSAEWWDSLSEDKQRAIVADAAPDVADRACWCAVAHGRLHLRGDDCRLLSDSAGTATKPSSAPTQEA